MKRSIRGFAIRLAVPVALAAGALAGAGAPAGFDHGGLAKLLRETVRGEGVDYELVRDRYLGDLERYLDAVAEVDTGTLPRAERLALFINLYNATVLRAVAERYEPGYTVERDAFALFDEPLVRVEGSTISLNRLEHDIVRARFGDPRIHVALVCAAKSCPPLLPRAYTAETLEATLETNMRRFVNDPARNVIDRDGRRLELSRIFDWYADDFGGKHQLARYVDRYTSAEVSGFEVAFNDYDWSLNRTPGD